MMVERRRRNFCGHTTVIVMLVVNLALMIYNFGRLSQKVDDVAARVSNLERIVYGGFRGVNPPDPAGAHPATPGR